MLTATEKNQQTMILLVFNLAPEIITSDKITFLLRLDLIRLSRINLNPLYTRLLLQ